MNMHIRELNEKDIPALSLMVQDSWQNAFASSMSKAEVDNFLKDNFTVDWFNDALLSDTFLVAETEGRLTGCVQISDIKLDIEIINPEDKAINTIYVDVKFQGQGIGKKLLEAALNHSLLKSSLSVYLDVWEENIKAVSLYKSFGFAKVGTIPFIVDGETIGEDIIMKLDRKQS